MMICRRRNKEKEKSVFRGKGASEEVEESIIELVSASFGKSWTRGLAGADIADLHHDDKVHHHCKTKLKTERGTITARIWRADWHFN